VHQVEFYDGLILWSHNSFGKGEDNFDTTLSLFDFIVGINFLTLGYATELAP
jgi:hypothetical protein